MEINRIKEFDNSESYDVTHNLLVTFERLGFCLLWQQTYSTKIFSPHIHTTPPPSAEIIFSIESLEQ